ncbi:hypothetical protein OSB04_un000315 [Centaurea solstitialis]|uniref:DUF659 domain-containing protein n=1 Tax=Centaurea solstitialis TaxID=347529 RepID=A0AA38SCV2_9ASTR|nr:hypothetical protein OSB04_un000315 [Centaurea solstitialis]
MARMRFRTLDRNLVEKSIFRFWRCFAPQRVGPRAAKGGPHAVKQCCETSRRGPRSLKLREREDLSVLNFEFFPLGLDWGFRVGAAKSENAGASKQWICKHCKGTYTRSYTRIHVHFFGPRVGEKANTKRCPKFLGQTYERIWNKVKEAENGGVAKSLKNSALSKSLSSKKRLEESFKMLERNTVDLKIMRDECVRDVEKDLTQVKDTWYTQGLSIVSDGWSNVKNRPLINVLAVNSRGAMFMYAKDFSGVEKTGLEVSKFLLGAIETVGLCNVLQMVTDNAANCKAAGHEIEKSEIEEKSSSITRINWSSKETASVLLILEEIYKVVPCLCRCRIWFKNSDKEIFGNCSVDPLRNYCVETKPQVGIKCLRCGRSRSHSGHLVNFSGEIFSGKTCFGKNLSSPATFGKKPSFSSETFRMNNNLHLRHPPSSPATSISATHHFLRQRQSPPPTIFSGDLHQPFRKLTSLLQSENSCTLSEIISIVSGENGGRWEIAGKDGGCREVVREDGGC